METTVWIDVDFSEVPTEGERTATINDIVDRGAQPQPADRFIYLDMSLADVLAHERRPLEKVLARHGARLTDWAEGPSS